MKKIFALMALALITAPLLAQKTAVAPGYDLWKTIGDGSTFMSFVDSPIPAGFFFEGSETFTGKIEFNGAPLATQPLNALGGADTIIERLDAGVFNDEGVAVSRMRIKALSLVSADPIEVGGSLWDVSASLTEKQPVTEIAYYQRGEDAGVFHADLVVNVRLTFTHRTVKKLAYSLDRTVHFTDYYEAPFKLGVPEDRMKARPTVMIDTNGDGVAETPLTPIQSVIPALTQEFIANQLLTEEDLRIYHTAPTHAHNTQLAYLPSN